MKNPIYKALVIAPAALVVFYLSMVGGFNVFNTVLAWTNPSATPPTESLVPIPVSDGGTGASSAASARADLGAAASGANSDITSLSPSGNLIISPTGGVGIGTTSLISGAMVTVNGNLVTTGELQSTLQTGDGQIRMIAGNYGAMWRNDGTNTWFLLTASGNQYGGWNSLRPMQINDSSGEVYMANGLDVTSGGITFPDGTVQTTAAVSATHGSQAFTSSGTFTVPSGVTQIMVIITGGGGGGGGGTNQNTCAYGSGGGAGGTAMNTYIVSGGEQYTVAIGAGGGGVGYNNNGGAGTASQFSGNGITPLIANGGSGGLVPSSYVTNTTWGANGGSGGTVSGNISSASQSGQSGSDWVGYCNGNWSPGNGGSSIWAAGGLQGNGGNGGNGSYGSGGGGSLYGYSSGSGGSGYALIFW